jgi:hypothetical protein
MLDLHYFRMLTEQEDKERLYSKDQDRRITKSILHALWKSKEASGTEAPPDAATWEDGGEKQLMLRPCLDRRLSELHKSAKSKEMKLHVSTQRPQLLREQSLSRCIHEVRSLLA